MIANAPSGKTINGVFANRHKTQNLKPKVLNAMPLSWKLDVIPFDVPRNYQIKPYGPSDTAFMCLCRRSTLFPCLERKPRSGYEMKLQQLFSIYNKTELDDIHYCDKMLFLNEHHAHSSDCKFVKYFNRTDFRVKV